MNFEAMLAVTAPPEVAYAALLDMTDWAQWNTLVQRVEVDREGRDNYAAWYVDLGAQIGLVRLTRHFRMVRVEEDPSRFVRFERFEVSDTGGDHSDAVIEAELLDDRQWMLRLHYGGFLPIPGLIPFMRNEIGRSLRRFNQLLAASDR